MRIRVGLAGLVALAACQSTGPSRVGLGEEFELAPNQSVAVAQTNLTIGFRRVAGDSRCPIDLLCVTEGTAGVELELFGSAEAGPVLVNSPFPKTWTSGTYRVTLLELTPQQTAKAINPADYRIRLIVDLVR